MDWIKFSIGVLLIILGILLIKIYYDIKPEHKGGLTFKLRTGGIGCIIIGIALISREIL